MREKRYSKDMKGTQEKKEESYPYFDLYPIEREIVRSYEGIKNRKQYLLVMLPFLLRHCSRACRP